jgi:hypothetical protein
MVVLMSAYLIVDAHNVVQNNIEWDAVSPYEPPAGTRLVAHDGPAGAGWQFDGKRAVDPRPVEEPPASPPQPPAITALERLAAELGMSLEALRAKLARS